MRMKAREEENTGTVIYDSLPLRFGALFFGANAFIEAVQELSLQISLFLSYQGLLFSLRLVMCAGGDSTFVSNHFLDSLANHHKFTSTPIQIVQP